MIGPRTEADLPAVLAMLARVQAADGYPMVPPADPVRFVTPAPTLALLVARAGDGRIAGHAAVYRGVTGPAAEELAAAAGVPVDRLGWVGRLLVDPDQRAAGHGRALVAAAARAATDAGYQPVLDVLAHAPAVTLYDRLGWRRVTTHAAAWTAPDGSHPAIHYYLAPAG